MVKIREAIVVEGRYDKNTLSQIVDAPIFQTDGFGIFRDREKMRLLRRTAEKLGLIVGESVEDDLVNEIFSKFCMGK